MGSGGLHLSESRKSHRLVFAVHGNETESLRHRLIEHADAVRRLRTAEVCHPAVRFSAVNRGGEAVALAVTRQNGRGVRKSRHTEGRRGMSTMVCDVIVHDRLSQETDLLHEVHVLDPMSVRELSPLAAYLLALLRETLGGRELVARRGVELRG